MKKLVKVVMPALTLCAVMLMASCGDGGGDTPTPVEPEKSPADITATVTWWNNYADPTTTAGYDEATARKSNTYTEYFFAKDTIAEFNKLYPNITVNSVYKGSYSDIQKAVNTAINSGDTPDMASGYADSTAGYVSAGASLDVSKYFDDASIGFGKTVDTNGKVIDDPTTTKADFNQSYLIGEGNQYGGKYYSMPYSKSGEVMAINQTLFDKVGAGETGTTSYSYSDPTKVVYEAPVAAATKTKYEVPTNWTDLISTARKMKADYPDVFKDAVDEDGLFKAVPICWDSAENMYISFSEMLGIPYTANDSSVAKSVLFNNDAAKKMVVQIKKWNNEGLIGTQNQNYYSNKAKGYHQYSSTMMTNGKCFVCFSSTAGASYFADGGSFEASLNETPNVDSSIYGTGTPTSTKSKVISQGPSISFFKKSNEDEQKASFIFYKYLTSTDNTAKLSVAKAYFPLRASGYETETVKKLTSAAGTTTAASSYADKKTDYIGQVLKLNETYTSGSRYISTAVFDYSSACRTAVGNLMTAVLNDKTAKTDDEITAVVDKAFKDAYSSVVTQ